MRSLLALCLLTGAAHAADIEVTSPERGPLPAYVSVKGRIEKEDGGKFVEITKDLDRAVVVFDSHGGYLRPAVLIGLAMRRKGFIAKVADGAHCASACAYAWLGGTERIIGRGGSVGFHSSKKYGTSERSEAGNAVIKIYLHALGYSDAVYDYVISADPRSMNWLSEEAADRFGITPMPRGYPPPKRRNPPTWSFPDGVPSQRPPG